MGNQHFFKPLLPGLHIHLTIPVAFFLKNIEGKYEHKMAELRSDASKITWKVKIDGERLTNGWKEFALAHDLQIGDILIFRQERDMSFHMTMLGPSCCEIQFVSCLNDENNLGKIVVIDPYSLEVTPLMPSPYKTLDYLIPCGNDELFLAEVTSQVTRVRGSELLCRVSRLDEEAGRWVEVTDLGGRVLFIVQLANVASRSFRMVVV